MDESNAKTNKVSTEERIARLVYNDEHDASLEKTLFLEQDLRRIDFIKYLHIDMHLTSGQGLIDKIELIREIVKTMEKDDVGLANIFLGLLQEKLASVKNQYDKVEVNKEYLFQVRKAVNTWKSEDKRKDFNYDHYIELAEARVACD